MAFCFAPTIRIQYSNESPGEGVSVLRGPQHGELLCDLLRGPDAGHHVLPLRWGAGIQGAVKYDDGKKPKENPMGENSDRSLCETNNPSITNKRY